MWACSGCCDCRRCAWRSEAARDAGHRARSRSLRCRSPSRPSTGSWWRRRRRATGSLISTSMGHPALVPPTARSGGLARHRPRVHEPSDRLVWERRTLFGDEPQVRASERATLWRRPDFAGLPALRGPSRALPHRRGRDAYRCVWFTDLRYDLPALPDTFRYGLLPRPRRARRGGCSDCGTSTVDGLEPLRRSSSATP